MKLRLLLATALAAFLLAATSGRPAHAAAACSPFSFLNGQQLAATALNSALAQAATLGASCAGDGNVAAPGISFASTPSTGLYRRSDGGIGLVVAGTELVSALISGTTVNGPVQANTFSTPALAYAMSTAAITPLLKTNSTFSGTVSGGGAVNQMFVSGDTMNCAAGSDGTCKLLELQWNLNNIDTGGSNVGGRVGLWVQLNPSAALTGSHELVGVNAQMFANYNMGNSDLQPIASAVGVGPNGNHITNTLNEFDYYVQAGGSVLTKGALLINLSASDAVAGTTDDAGIFMTNGNLSGLSPGMGFGISFGSTGSGFPVNPATGTLIGVTQQLANGGGGRNGKFIVPTAKGGVDLWNVNFSVDSGNSFRAPGFNVDGLGDVFIGGGKIAPTPSGLSISAPNFIVQGNPTVVSGGSGYYGSEIVFGPGNVQRGQYQIAVSAGVVTSLTTLTPDINTTAIAGTQSLTGASGTGLTATFSMSQGSQIAIGGAGQDTIIGSGSALATSATSGFFHLPFTSAAPTGTPGNTTPACEWNTATHALNCYDGASWYHFTGTSGAG